MGYSIRSTGEVLAALLTAAFLLVDLTGESASGIPWQLLALISFAVFVGFMIHHVNSLNSRLHSPEHQIDIVIRPDPPIDDWYKITTMEETRKHTVWAFFWVDLRNSDSVDRTVNEICLELREARRWWGWPVRRQIMVVVPPVRVDSDGDWYKRDRPTHVDWTIPAGGATVSHRLHFTESWDSKKGKLPKWSNLDLAFEVGGRAHRRRIDIEPFDVKA